MNAMQAVAVWRRPARPPRRNSRFMVGRDALGRWIVTDIKGLAGGVFADRTAAIHFAMAECDYDPGEVCAAPEGVVLSLDSLFVEGWKRAG